MKSISPRESMEYSIELLEAVKTFSETTEMDLEQSIDMTIRILKLHLKQPNLEIVKND